MKEIELKPGELDLDLLRQVYNNPVTFKLAPSYREKVVASQKVIKKIIKENKVVYGVNTGFGKLATTVIEPDKLEQLQENLILSHASGVGALLSDKIVRLILVLKINALAQGYSGVSPELIEALLKLVNSEVYPCIPSKGSVGASGDLAPLSHMSCLLLGVGKARYENKIIDAHEALAIASLKPVKLQAKEGLALCNGTQVSNALALASLFETEKIFKAAMFAGALSIDATKGSPRPFKSCVHEIRGQTGQIKVAEEYLRLLKNSEIRNSHKEECHKVQDPYCLRCMPQVMGACLDNLLFVTDILYKESNAVSDNPLVYAETEEVISGGNFHAQPVGMAADILALAISEIGSMSERRIAMLIDGNISELPSFLTEAPGINSGFMIAHVTAAALASENKQMSHPASVDSIPTSANQEDHVSMATHAARRLLDMAENTATIIGIELLAAAQGIEFQRPLSSSQTLEEGMKVIRSHVPKLETDRYFADDIQEITKLVTQGRFDNLVKIGI